MNPCLLLRFTQNHSLLMLNRSILNILHEKIILLQLSLNSLPSVRFFVQVSSHLIGPLKPHRRFGTQDLSFIEFFKRYSLFY